MEEDLKPLCYLAKRTVLKKFGRTESTTWSTGRSIACVLAGTRPNVRFRANGSIH